MIDEQYWRVRLLVTMLAALVLVLGACGSPDPVPLTEVTPGAVVEEPVVEEPVVEDEVVEEEVEEEVVPAEPEPAEATPEVEEEPDVVETPEPAEEPDATPAPDEEPAATPEPDEEVDVEDFLASITLPDGTVCLYAGLGAAMMVGEQRVSYVCENEEEGVVLDELSTQEDMLTVTYGVRGEDEDALDSSEEIEMRISEVILADGTVCTNAGQDDAAAELAGTEFDEGQVYFTCDDDSVLVGDMEIDMDVLTATRATVTGEGDEAELSETESVAVTEVVGEEAEETEATEETEEAGAAEETEDAEETEGAEEDEEEEG